MKLKTQYFPDNRKVSILLKKGFPWWILILLVALLLLIYFLYSNWNHLDIIPPSNPSSNQEQIDLDERIEDANASKGQITISLGWNNTNDLDLHVLTPCGEYINYEQIGEGLVCGGYMEYDKNADSDEVVNTPFEHILWSEGHAVDGDYAVYVHNYNQRESNNKTNFEVHVTIDGEKNIYKGTIGGEDAEEKVVQFTYGNN